MLKIGLTQRVESLEDRTERRDCLDQEWARLLSTVDLAPVAIPNRLTDLEIFVDSCDLDGFILTGGNDLAHLATARHSAPERDDTERGLLSLASRRRLPVLGVCRGMQMMVTDAGGTLIPVAGHVAVRHELEVCGSATMPLTNREWVNSFHDFAVPGNGLGPEWQAVASAPDGTVEAAAHRSLRHWAIMWHPERDPFDSRDLQLIRTLFEGGR